MSGTFWSSGEDSYLWIGWIYVENETDKSMISCSEWEMDRKDRSTEDMQMVQMLSTYDSNIGLDSSNV